MQLKKRIEISHITILAILASNTLQAENYVSMEFLRYDENNDRVSVLAPAFNASYDIGTDYNIKASFMNDTITGATPVWRPDTASSASGRNNRGDYSYENQEFDEVRNESSVMLTTRFANRDELYTGVNYSSESDFSSKTASVEYLHYTDRSHNRSISLGASYSFNELLSYDFDGGSYLSEQEESTSLNLQLGMSQVLNDHSVVKIEAFTILESGYLTNPYGNVIRDYGSINQRIVTERRPDNRRAYGMTLKYVTLFLENTSYRGNYRFYRDDWDINSHTLENDIYYELNRRFTFGLGLRYYTQTEATFYNGSKDFFSDERFASSDFRLSSFDAFTYKASIDFQQNEKISYNLGTQFYTQSTGLDATMITTGLKYRF